MKEAVSWKKDQCQNNTEENRRRYKSMKNKAMIEMAEYVLTKVLEKRLSRIVTIDEMQFCFMPERNN